MADVFTWFKMSKMQKGIELGGSPHSFLPAAGYAVLSALLPLTFRVHVLIFSRHLRRE